MQFLHVKHIIGEVSPITCAKYVRRSMHLTPVPLPVGLERTLGRSCNQFREVDRLNRDGLCHES
jgi:hypothetical protein